MFGALTPIDDGGYIVFVGSGTGWQQMPFPGAALTPLDFAAPANASAAIVHALTDVPFCLSPEAIIEDGGLQGMTLGAGCQLQLNTRTQVQQFCALLSGSTSFAVQFFSGPGGLLPLTGASQTGGGGGGTVTAVTASLPLTSSGGPTPNIAIGDGTAGQVLQWEPIGDGGAWQKHTGLQPITYVDSVYGNDATSEPNNPFLPYKTLQAAIYAYASGVTFIVCRGTANYTITAKLPPQNWRIDVPDGTLTNSNAGLWLSSNSTAVINADVIGNFQAGDNSHFILNGSLTGTAKVAYAAASLVINGDHIGNILTGIGPITINGGQLGTVTSSAATAVITIKNGICGKVSGTYLKLNLTNAIVESITGDDPAHPILVTAQNSTCSQLIENATMQSGSTGNYGFFAEAITFPLGTVTDGTVRLVKFGQPTTIFYASVQSDAGTTTLAVNIAGTPITGLDAIDISDTESSASATAANLAAIGDYLSFTFSDSAGAEGVTVTLYYQEIVP